MESKLKEIAESRGVKQKWIEQQTGVSHSAMSLLWNGRSEPTLRNARKIARVLGVTVDDLWPEEESE